MTSKFFFFKLEKKFFKVNSRYYCLCDSYNNFTQTLPHTIISDRPYVCVWFCLHIIAYVCVYLHSALYSLIFTHIHTPKHTYTQTYICMKRGTHTDTDMCVSNIYIGLGLHTSTDFINLIAIDFHWNQYFVIISLQK